MSTTVTGTALRKWRKDISRFFAERRARADEQWELAEFWRDLVSHTCRACLREARDLDRQRICVDCWKLAKASRPLGVSEQIRVNRLLHLELQ